MNKENLKNAMLALEEAELAHAREKYALFLAESRMDRTEPIENDEAAYAEWASELAEAFDQPVHGHAEKLDRLRSIDFGPKTQIEEGAVVQVGGRNLVIAVATTQFESDGQTFMGISTSAPIYEELEGKSAGENVDFRGRSMTIDAVY